MTENFGNVFRECFVFQSRVSTKKSANSNSVKTNTSFSLKEIVFMLVNKEKVSLVLLLCSFCSLQAVMLPSVEFICLRVAYCETFWEELSRLTRRGRSIRRPLLFSFHV